MKPSSKKDAITAECAMGGFANEITTNMGIKITPIILLIRKMMKVYEFVTVKLPVTQPVSFKVEYLPK
jgi:hypothetical protein